MTPQSTVDVTESQRVGKELDALSAELTLARNEVRRWRARADAVAHDLRNPLTAVSMSLEMLCEKPLVCEDEDARWVVDRAVAAVARMEELIEQLGQPPAV